MSNSFPIVSAPFFLARFSMWPFELHNKTESEGSLMSLFRANEDLREAILIASPTLYDSLTKEKPLTKQQTLGLLKYVIRMTSRSTPFGLFSFVAKGTFSDKSNLFIQESNIVKSARFDMEWYYSFLEKGLEDWSNLDSISIRSNPLIEKRGGRLFLNFSKNKARIAFKRKSIRQTPIASTILKECKNSILVSDLVTILKKSPYFDLDKTIEMLKYLLQNQFLTPGLIPSLYEAHDVVTQITDNEESLVRDLKKQVENYQKTPIGYGEEKLKALHEKMKAEVDVENCIHVDSASKDTVCLSKDIVHEIKNAALLLWKISFSKSNNHLLGVYHQRFLEKYGTYRTVPILEMLQLEKGLGPLERLQMEATIPKKPSSFSKTWEKWCLDQWQECLKNNKKEVVISDEIITDLFNQSNTPQPSFDKLPPAFDIFCKRVKTKSDLSDDEIQLIITQPAWQGCATFGRFLQLLGEDALKDCQDFLKEAEQEKGVKFVELCSWPSQIRSGNIAIQPRMRRNYLDLDKSTSDSNALTLEDIYVGATLDRFYLTTKDGGEEICSVSGNLMIADLLPSAFAFMRSVTLERYQQIYPFSWPHLNNNATFLPRVRIDKTVIFPCTWNVNATTYKEKSSEFIQSSFEKFIDQWELPNLFYLTENDQQLLLDHRNPLHLDEIIGRLSKGKSLVLTEYINEDLIEGTKGNYCSELVIPFRKKHETYPIHPSFSPPAFEFFSDKDRFVPVNDGWLYAKVYLERETMDTFLLSGLFPLTKKLQEQGIIDQFFFVRYADPDPHLRIRFKTTSNEALEIINEAATYWKRDGLIKSMIYLEYERELERYGGLETYQHVESLFSADSAYVETILPFIEKDAAYYQSVSVLFFLQALGFSREEMSTFFENYNLNKKNLEGFHNHRKKLREVLKFENSPDILKIKENLSQLKSFAKELKYQLAESTTTWDTITHSLLHMHCNRIGCDQQMEKRSVLYAKHALHSHQLELEDEKIKRSAHS